MRGAKGAGDKQLPLALHNVKPGEKGGKADRKRCNQSRRCPSQATVDRAGLKRLAESIEAEAWGEAWGGLVCPFFDTRLFLLHPAGKLVMQA